MQKSNNPSGGLAMMTIAAAIFDYCHAALWQKPVVAQRPFYRHHNKLGGGQGGSGTLTKRQWNTRRPVGYYEQEITDTRFMSPRQRREYSQGLRIVHGKLHGVAK